MSRERVLERRLRTLGTLDEAVGALRSLSAQHFRAARTPLAAARAYREEVERFLAVLPPARPADGTTGIVVIAADLGLVGDYSAEIVREALNLREERGPGPVVCVGRRALAPMARAGIEPTSVHDAPTSVESLTGFLLPLVDALLALRRAGALDSLWLVAARFAGAGHYAPARARLLPVAAREGQARIRTSPYADAPHLEAVVVREFLHAALYETLLEALASEHGKRLVMASSARSWLEERIAATRRLVAALRREASTQEVLEVAIASRAARRARGGPA